jgi:hypothetical protein
MEKNIFWNEIDTSGVHNNYNRTAFFKTYNKIINWVDKLQEMEQEWVSIMIMTYDLNYHYHLIYMKKEDIDLQLEPYTTYVNFTEPNWDVLTDEMKNTVIQTLISLDKKYEEYLVGVEIEFITSFSTYALQMYLYMYSNLNLCELIVNSVFDWAHQLMALKVYTLKEYMDDIHRFVLYEYIGKNMSYRVITAPFKMDYSITSNLKYEQLRKNQIDDDITTFINKFDKKFSEGVNNIVIIMEKYVCLLKEYFTEVQEI